MSPGIMYLAVAPLLLACTLSLFRPKADEPPLAKEVVEWQSKPAKRALIVAIADYSQGPPDEASQYPDLNADNDIPLIESALYSQGFDSAHVHVLRDQNATKAGIVSAFRRFLIEPAGPGDVLVFHYSGHGHRITDDDGDEPDGYDEVLVPYGAPPVLRDGYQGERHLRDDELNHLLREARAKVAPDGNVVIFIDACFSGSATRAVYESLVRGLAIPIGPPATGAARAIQAEEGSGLWDPVPGPVNRGLGDEVGTLLAPYVVFSAARHDEVAREILDRDGGGVHVGALSLALSRALVNARPGSTYREVFAYVRQEMAGTVPGQTPQLEGAVDTELFSGLGVAQPPYVLVEALEGDTAVLLRGGSLIGLLPGSGIAFHPVGTTQPEASTPLATGRVREAYQLRARVLLDAPVAPGPLATAWAFVTETAHPDLTVRVQIESSVSAALRAQLESGLAKSAIVEVVGRDSDLIVVANASEGGTTTLQLRRSIDSQPVSPLLDVRDGSIASRVLDRSVAYARSIYLRRMHLRDPAIDVQLELIPSLGKVDERSGLVVSCQSVDAEGFVTAGNEWVFSPGDWFKLRLHNQGEKYAYVTVLDLMPDGQIGQLYPDPEHRGEDNLIEAGTSYVLPDVSVTPTEPQCFEVVEPYGVEVLKLFATSERVDFWPILVGSQGARGSTNPLERFFVDLYAGTRAERRTLSGGASTFSVTIRVVQP